MYSTKPTDLLMILLLTWLTPCLLGCGNNSGRVEVLGTVSVDGRPLESGLINFRPVEIGSAPGSGSGIVNGRFNLPANKGLMPGKYRVMIKAFKNTGRMQKDPSGGPSFSDQMEIAFNESGKLEATIVDGGKNNFAFELTTVR